MGNARKEDVLIAFFEPQQFKRVRGNVFVHHVFRDPTKTDAAEQGFSL